MAVKRIVPKFIISSRPSSGASPPAVAFVGSIGWCPAWTRLRGEQARSCWQLGNSSSRSRLSPYPSSPVQRRTGILCRLQHQPYRACPQPWNHIINGITTYLSSCLSRGLPATAEERGPRDELDSDLPLAHRDLLPLLLLWIREMQVVAETTTCSVAYSSAQCCFVVNCYPAPESCHFM
jgi:hypothetical protein